MTRVTWIRHGETDENVARRWQGQSDVPLNDQGRRQAALLAQRLRKHTPTAIYSSDLSRAFETATTVAARVGKEVVPWVQLREIDTGKFTGSTGDECSVLFPEAFTQFRAAKWDFAFPGGESYDQLQQRTWTAMQTAIDSHPDGDVWLFSHGGTIGAALYAAFGLRYGQGPIALVGNTSLSTFRWDASHGQFVIERFNDTSHLEQEL